MPCSRVNRWVDETSRAGDALTYARPIVSSQEDGREQPYDAEEGALLVRDAPEQRALHRPQQHWQLQDLDAMHEAQSLLRAQSTVDCLTDEVERQSGGQVDEHPPACVLF